VTDCVGRIDLRDMPGGRMLSAVPRRPAVVDPAFGRALKALREAKGWYQGDLSKATAISQGSVSDWETAQVHPSREHLTRLASALDVTVTYLNDIIEGRGEKIVRSDLPGHAGRGTSASGPRKAGDDAPISAPPNRLHELEVENARLRRQLRAAQRFNRLIGAALDQGGAETPAAKHHGPKQRRRHRGGP
jgi:transcriptional regulator with XRE-family HTH domain